MEGYYLRPSATVLRLREEFPDFLICELHAERGGSCFIATSARTGAHRQPELIVRGCAEELRSVLSTLSSTTTATVREGGKA